VGMLQAPLVNSSSSNLKQQQQQSRLQRQCQLRRPSQRPARSSQRPQRQQ
jgi:hypothetical protein